MPENPIVSVVIPAYNSASYIQQAVNSALNQTYQNVEVIVVDDGSTDDTSRLLNANYGSDTRVHVISQANTGPAGARNHGIREASGEYVHFLDADEFLLPTKIEKSLALFQQNAAVHVVYGHGTPVLPDGLTEIPMDYPPLPSGDVFCEWLNGTMSGGTYGVTSSVMVRKIAFEKAGFFDGYCSPAEDWDLWLRLAMHFDFAALDERLVIYRRIPGGLHANRLKMAIGRLRVYEKARAYQREWVQHGHAACIPEADFDRLMAGRWQVVALRHWEMGERAEARQALDQAIRLYPPQANLRRLYKLMSYTLPAASVDAVGRLSDFIKRRT